MTDLHTALQREREALDRMRDGIDFWPSADGWSAYRAAQRATDQALAALETRPPLAEVELDRLIDKAFTHRTLSPDERAALHDLLGVLYGRGGVE